MRKSLLAALFFVGLWGFVPRAHGTPIYITFVWHMHQPIYWPGENVAETSSAGHYSFSVLDVHTSRTGPYTTWPRDAIAAARAAGLNLGGTQVSLTGSLLENLDTLESAGLGFSGWRNPWNETATWLTTGGNPAVDLIGFGYFHPLSALIAQEDVATQIKLHREAIQRRFPGYPVSRGLFPPETAFSERIIPALNDAGIEWVVVDNVHFDRTLTDYPYSAGSNLYPPNKADQRESIATDWVQFNGIWAPSRVSAPFGYQPHFAEYIDPQTGQSYRVIVVPGARYEGNEDARGGFGALNYDEVLSQLEPYNTDPDHPILVVLHHDGDNYGGGSDSYYHANFQAFVNWLVLNPTRFQFISIQDYLDQFPPDANDVIHVEDGSWSGADNGDPEFLKWNGDPGTDGYSPDRTSWAILTAAKNRMQTATAIEGEPTLAEIYDSSTTMGRAWRSLLMAQASDYWYWDNSENGIWDSHPARASNIAMAEIGPILSGLGTESVPPYIYPPQREPYNPGEIEWGTEPTTSELTVWTFAYDVSGLSRVELFYRFDSDGQVDAQNHTYGTSEWCVVPMTARTIVPRTDPAPAFIADEYSVTIPGLGGNLIDYYVEAEDSLGNISRSGLRHVWVGTGGNGTGPGASVGHYPQAPGKNSLVTVYAHAPGKLHWGINGWTEPPAEYWPSDTTAFGDGQSVETTLTGPGYDGRYSTVLGPFNGTTAVTELDYVIHYDDDSWSASDVLVTVDTAPGSDPLVELVEPAEGARVEGIIRLIAAASDDTAVSSVTFLVDGSEVGSVSEPPYELQYDSSALSAGSHVMMATATDDGGNAVSDSHTVEVGGSGSGECAVGPQPDAGVDS
ncbi:hypothetical protein KJ865_15620, partial [Myxococcota bacterium]|nr:hypothetical protein [Myxococcota bacterium]